MVMLSSACRRIVRASSSVRQYHLVRQRRPLQRPFSTSNQHEPPKKEDSFVRNNRPVVDGRVMAGGLLVLSIAASLGSLYLVSQDGQEQVQSRSYLSVPSVELSRRFSTSGSAGAAVTVEALSVGEQISPEGLLERYAFDETELDDNPRAASDKGDNKIKKKQSRRKQMQVIGKGAYGRVVRALNRSTGQKVAMKVVPHSAMSAEALLEEVEVLKRVRGHDNIIHLIDVMYCGGKYYVITELCEGGEILDHLITHGPFTERASSTIIHRMASALQHIHKCGYVHLDMKPENIVFAHRKSVDDCRVIDFGMARKISEVTGNLSMVRGEKGSRVGTLAYWSPEQVASVVGSDGRNLSDLERTLVKSDARACDMWALGIVLYIMLLGCHPFDPHGRGNERDMARSILKGKYRFDIHGDKLKISKEAQDLISGLLDPNPATRYTSTDVQEHPFLVNVQANKKPTHVETLPTSWTKQGYKVNRDDEVDQLVESGNEDRLIPFESERTGEAFARVLLMAAGVNGRNVYLQEEDENEITSERLFLDAFSMFEITKNGRLSPRSVETLLRATGDEAEDEVVVSYHKYHDEPVKVPLVKRLLGGKNAQSSKANPQEPKQVHGNNQGITFDEFKAYLRKLDCVTRFFDAEEVVFSQGSVPQGFYVLLNGEARLEYKDPGSTEGTPRFSYARLGPGSMFGEAALIKGAKTRNSTIRCSKHSEVLFIPKDIFLRALAGSPALNEVLFKVAMKQQAKRLHELVEYLKPKGMVVKHLSPGQVLFRQGEKADFMYLIQDGFVGSNTSAPSSRARGAEDMSVKLAERGPGDLIGSSAATGGGGKRYSTAKCITPVTVIGIPIEELTRLRREEPVFRFYLENLIQTRKEFWQSQIADVERGVSEPQLLPLLLQEDDCPSLSEMEQGESATEGSLKTTAEPERKEAVTEKKAVGGSWGSSLLGVIGYLNPGYWLGYGSDGHTKEKKDEDETEEEDLSDYVITKHMAAFESYAHAVGNMQHVKFKGGDYVVQKGEEPKNFYIVDSGTVSVEYVSPSGEVLIVAQLGPGDHFGEMALMEKLPSYTTSFRCVSDCEVLSMKRSDFFALIGDGETTFAHAIKNAMKLRQHRWVRNLLKLAKEDKRIRRLEAQESRRKHELEQRKRRSDMSRHLGLIEMDDDSIKEEDVDFIDRDKIVVNRSSSKFIKERIAKYNSEVAARRAESSTKSNPTSGGVTRVILQPGDTLFKKGAPVDAIYMVHRGELTLYDDNGPKRKKLPKGEDTLGPGDTVGTEQCGSCSHSYAAVCSAPNTIVSKIPQSTLDILIEGHDFVSQNLKRHARRTVPMNELERRAKVDLQKHGSYSSTMLKASVRSKALAAKKKKEELERSQGDSASA